MFVDDLRLAMYAARELSDPHYDFRDREAVREFLDLLGERDSYRTIVSDAAYGASVNVFRRQAQEELLGGTRVRLEDLGYLNGIAPHPREFDAQLSAHIVASHDPLFKVHPVRVLLRELPQKEGTSDAYKQEIDAKLRQFKKKFGRVLQPLLLPITLQVVVKPPSRGRAFAIHDLDNVVRTYLLPKIVEVLQPPGDLYNSWGKRLLSSPASTRIGVTRYEAWRLERVRGDDTPGFVSVAVVAEGIHHDLLSRMDSTIDDWQNALD